MSPVGTASAAADYADRLWTAVVEGNDEPAAARVVRQALDDGIDPETVLLDAIGAVQLRVGLEWAANRISVAQEHAATAINDRVISTVAQHVTLPEPSLGRVVVTCVDGEWHALPARLLSEVLKLRGFRVDYLGAQIPTPHLISHLHLTGPDAVALSGSLAPRLPTAHATITACQAAGTPVIVGGAAFGEDGRYARLLGADAWSANARDAAEQLTGKLSSPRRSHQPIDDLPHLADQEYTLVARRSGELVRAAYVGLTQHDPVVSGYTESQLREVGDTLSHLVDFLCAALYTGDDVLFTGFLAWSDSVITDYGRPAGYLLPAVRLLAAELRDFPRATRMLDAGRHQLDDALGDSL